MELLMFVGGYMMLRSLDCVSLATMGPNKFKYMFQNYIKENEIRNESSYEHFGKEQFENLIEEEVIASLERKDIDVSLFKMSFLGALEKKMQMKLLGFQKMKKMSRNDKRRIIYETSFFQNKYPGVNIAKILIQNAYDSNINPKILKAVSLILGIIYALLPSLFRVFMKKDFFGENEIEILMAISLFLLNIYYYYKNCVLAMFCFYEYNNLDILLTQLTNLLACKKDNNNGSKKILPTIDFFYPLSMKSWGILHNIFRDYGKKYKIRINCYLTLYMLANIFAGLFLIISFYGKNGLFDWIKAIGVAYEFSVFAIISFLILLKAANINDKYNIHRSYVHDNLNIINDLKNHYLFYFEQYEILPENLIYIEGVSRIQIYSQDIMDDFIKRCSKDKDKYEKQLKEIRMDLLRNLSKLLKENTIKLNYGLEMEPLTLLGIPISYGLLSSLFAVTGSLVAASIQGFFQRYYEGV